MAAGILALLGAFLLLVTVGMRKGRPAVPPVEEPAAELDAARIARGRAIYEARCIGCHGPQGVGESPGNPAARDAEGRFLAPPLDGSGHAWHHTDEDLVAFIADGSPRNPRMKAWKTELSREQIRDVVEYIKSLWGPRELACQGPRHMDPECFRGH